MVSKTATFRTCQHVGVNSQGGYSGEPQSALRTACQWLKLQITGNNTLTTADHGRVYDSYSNPFYYMLELGIRQRHGDGFFVRKRPTYRRFLYRAGLTAQPNKLILIQAGRS